MGRYIVGVTGASGSVYAMRLIEVLLKEKHEVLLTITKAGLEVIKQEVNLELTGLDTEKQIEDFLNKHFDSEPGKLTFYDINHIGATIASGSFCTDGMVILPCSMATVSAIANGASNNLLERAADVILKERKKLIVVPRETPLNQIHLKNLLTLAQNNVHIVPAMPAFYNKPQTIDDLVNSLVGRILDQLCLENSLFNRWEGV